MESMHQFDEIRWKAKRLSFRWAKWLRQNGKPVDRTRRQQLEADLDRLLRVYREKWGVDLIGVRLDSPRAAAEPGSAGGRGRL